MSASDLPTLRLFIALPLPDSERAALQRIQEDLRRTNADMKWVKPENFHITLFFLGDVAGDRIDEIESKLLEMCRSHDPFPVVLHGLGAFPHLRRPKTPWAGFAGDLSPLKALAEAVSDGMAALGFERDKPFQPHLTLGRSRSDRGAKVLAEALQRRKDEPIGTFMVDTVTLYRSELQPQGPSYTALARMALGGSSSAPWSVRYPPCGE
ncbi:MAG: RNA 2',3'-cyclic phosphodiesterase [Armatimonadetes bacterium]|nr:RNA 2',3'-cyclic phosphodiesterase [Armatimonadota bacterium]